MIKVEPIGAQELVLELKVFEGKFVMPTDEFVRLYRAGELPEKDEFVDWYMTFEAWEMSTRASQRL